MQPFAAFTFLLVAAIASPRPALSQQSTAQVEATPRLYTPVPSNVPRPEFWLPDEPPHSFTISGERLYIGGNFSQIGPFTGPFAVVDATTGTPALSWPHCDGHVNAVIGDRHGGWFVGGSFSHVGGQSRSNLAHVLSDASVDPWSPPVGGEVYALALDQSTLYVTGTFQDIGAQHRYQAAAFDVTSGALLPWAPLSSTLLNQDSIQRILVDGSTVFLGGYFNTPSALPRRNLAAVDAATGSLVTAFNPDPDNSVWDLALMGSTLYVGGNFLNIGGVPRTRFAALDANSGAVGSLSATFDSTVLALAISGTTVYLGGLFANVNGQARARGAALDVTSGALLAWNPQAAIPDHTSISIQSLVVDNESVYVGGSFRSIGGQRQYGLGRVDASTGNALSWVGDAAGPDATTVASVASQDGLVACGGNFATMGGEQRDGIAAYDIVTGQLMPWHAEIYGQFGSGQPGDVLRILVSGDAVWIGGQFSYVNGVPLHALASLDATTGFTNTGFQVGFFFSGEFVEALALRGRTLFAGGNFHTPISGQSNLISVDSTTGAIVPGSTNTGPTVYDIALSTDQSRLYLAGLIYAVGNPSVPRNYLAAIDPTNGAVLPWNPNPDQIAVQIQFSDDRVWVAGNFMSISNQSHLGLASLDPITGTASASFAPILQYSGSSVGASALALYGGTVIAAGSFDTVNGLPQQYMAALNSSNGALLNWAPSLTNGVSRLCLGGGILFATSAQFVYPSGELRPFLAVYDAH
jgi:hypothetical protein